MRKTVARKGIWNAVFVSSLTVLMSGCSAFYTDNSSDYQTAKANDTQLQLPQGSIVPKDIMVIPNEGVIKDLTETIPFETPRSPFIFYPIAAVGYIEKEESIEFSVPTNEELSKRIILDYLSSIHGEGEVIASQTQDTVITIPLSLKKQSRLASVWSSITRLYPEQTVLSFQFVAGEKGTQIMVQIRHEKKGEEPTDWMSPVSAVETHAIMARLWGTIGRKIDESSAYLSALGETTDFPIWINHNGVYGVRLGDNASDQQVKDKIRSASLYLMPEAENMLSPVPEENVARVGDVVDFTVPLGNGERSQSLFNVYRRDLDDVEWQEREYPYEVKSQKEGDFLVIDVSKAKYPEIASFILAQRFIK